MADSITKISDLRPEHFDLWNNGLLWVLDKEVFIAIARGRIEEFRSLPIGFWRYPLRVRRTGRGVSYLMGSDALSRTIRSKLFPSHLVGGIANILQATDDLATRSEVVVDPLIREGVLVMTEPASGDEQDLYWSDDAWFVQNLKGRAVAHVP